MNPFAHNENETADVTEPARSLTEIQQQQHRSAAEIRNNLSPAHKTGTAKRQITPASSDAHYVGFRLAEDAPRSVSPALSEVLADDDEVGDVVDTDNKPAARVSADIQSQYHTPQHEIGGDRYIGQLDHRWKRAMSLPHQQFVKEAVCSRTLAQSLLKDIKLAMRQNNRSKRRQSCTGGTAPSLPTRPLGRASSSVTPGSRPDGKSAAERPVWTLRDTYIRQLEEMQDSHWQTQSEQQTRDRVLSPPSGEEPEADSVGTQDATSASQQRVPSPHQSPAHLSRDPPSHHNGRSGSSPNHAGNGAPFSPTGDHSDEELGGPSRLSIFGRHRHYQRVPSGDLKGGDSTSSSPATRPSCHGGAVQSSHTTDSPSVEYDTDDETDRLLLKPYAAPGRVNLPELANRPRENKRVKETQVSDPENPAVLLDGMLFRCEYLGSTQLSSQPAPSKQTRLMQAQEAVGRVKAPSGEQQPSAVVDLFVSLEKVMVLNTTLQDVIMDHSLKTISYIADMDNVVVLMVRRRLVPAERGEQHRIICHVFESESAQEIAHSIGQAFQLAYTKFLKENGLENTSTPFDLHQVLSDCEIYNDELTKYMEPENQREAVVTKNKLEALGVVVVESGWGSVIPTVVLANMLPTGPAARSGLLNIGDQLLSINGISLVGLPLASAQAYIKACRNQLAVRLTIVRCTPTVEVLIRRPDLKYQLGFSVHNGIICSLLRGGIAERGGVRVGHRIIEVNGQSVVAVTHERIVYLLANAVGEIRMKTMQMSIFRLLTGQEQPIYI